MITKIEFVIDSSSSVKAIKKLSSEYSMYRNQDGKLVIEKIVIPQDGQSFEEEIDMCKSMIEDLRTRSIYVDSVKVDLS